MHQEPEPQVMASKMSEIVSGRRARAQPPPEVAAHSRAELVVPPEENPALRRDGSGRGLSDVVQERTEP
jgi:hypothetical protein